MGLFPDATCASSRGGSFIHRTPVRRNIREGWHRLWGDYFSPDKIYSDKIETPGDGIIIFRGMQDHTADSIKSLEGFRIAWVDEAQNLSARSLSLLRPTIRSEGSELWASWNSLQLRLMRALEARVRQNGWCCIVSDTTDNLASANNLIRAGYLLYQPRCPWAWPSTLYWRKLMK